MLEIILKILGTRIGIGGICLVVGLGAGIGRTEWKYHEIRVAEAARSEMIAAADREFQLGQAKNLQGKSDDRKSAVDGVKRSPSPDVDCSIRTDRLRNSGK